VWTVIRSAAAVINFLVMVLKFYLIKSTKPVQPFLPWLLIT